MVTRTYDDNTVIIFDTTLRDGEQSPGATLSSAEKLEIARQLSRLGVDVIEAGFPASSPDDLKAVQRIAREVGTRPTVRPSRVCRARSEGDILDRVGRGQIRRQTAYPHLSGYFTQPLGHVAHRQRRGLGAHPQRCDAGKEPLR